MSDIDTIAQHIVLCPDASRRKLVELLCEKLRTELKRQCRDRDEAVIIGRQFADELCRGIRAITARYADNGDRVN
jgi:hypothetical protein